MAERDSHRSKTTIRDEQRFEEMSEGENHPKYAPPKIFEFDRVTASPVPIIKEFSDSHRSKIKKPARKRDRVVRAHHFKGGSENVATPYTWRRPESSNMKLANVTLKTHVNRLLSDNEQLNHRVSRMSHKNRSLVLERERLLTTIHNTAAILQSTVGSFAAPQPARPLQIENGKKEASPESKSDSDILERSTKCTIKEFDNLVNTLQGSSRGRGTRESVSCDRQTTKSKNISQYDIIVQWLNNDTWPLGQSTDSERSHSGSSTIGEEEVDRILEDVEATPEQPLDVPPEKNVEPTPPKPEADVPNVRPDETEEATCERPNENAISDSIEWPLQEDGQSQPCGTEDQPRWDNFEPGSPKKTQSQPSDTAEPEAPWADFEPSGFAENRSRPSGTADPAPWADFEASDFRENQSQPSGTADPEPWADFEPNSPKKDRSCCKSVSPLSPVDQNQDEHEEFIHLCNTMMERMDSISKSSQRHSETSQVADFLPNDNKNPDAKFSPTRPQAKKAKRRTLLDSKSNTSSPDTDEPEKGKTGLKTFQQCLANLEQINIRRTKNALTQTLIIEALRKLLAKQCRKLVTVTESLNEDGDSSDSDRSVRAAARKPNRMVDAAVSTSDEPAPERPIPLDEDQVQSYHMGQLDESGQNRRQSGNLYQIITNVSKSIIYHDVSDDFVDWRNTPIDGRLWRQMVMRPERNAEWENRRPLQQQTRRSKCPFSGCKKRHRRQKILTELRRLQDEEMKPISSYWMYVGIALMLSQLPVVRWFHCVRNLFTF